MARRKSNLHTRSKSVTVEGASIEHVDEETNQEMHKASTQDVQPPIRATRRPSKYLDVWDLPDNQIESEKNRDHRSKQEDLHIAGSCSFAVHAAKKAKADGRPVKRATLYSILHTRKDGTAVNPVVQAKMDKMKELLVEPSNQLQSSDTSGSIARAPDDVCAKVMGKERKGHIHGVRFGPSPSDRSSKSALTDLQIRSSQSRDEKVTQLKVSLAEMQEKLSSFDEMKERLSQFEEMEKRMARMLQQMQQITS
ncbi:uncharacterized protein LOC111994697 [Quercus suber]|uniref:uncharacterized protein LOC111994697 n=1 Tax=Quercus suber TaxID=58331 RepID=UPI000CE17978|nr:uncharacterized protein LOC111994697 [Quercus suber]POE73218.1 hypothetical protein CFP56_67858 [Quercus suber]